MSIRQIPQEEIFQELQKQKIFIDQVQLKGVGAYKQVYQCRKSETKEIIIIKISTGKGNIDLKNEYANSQKIPNSPFRLIKVDQMLTLQIQGEEVCVGISEIVGEKNLRMIIQSEDQPTLQNALKLFSDMLIAASECLISGFQHLDIKPVNVVIFNQDFYLIDFSSQNGYEVITPFYSPKDFNQQKSFNNYDIFSLGITVLQYLRVKKLNDSHGEKQKDQELQENLKILVNYIKFYMLNDHHYQRQSMQMMLKIFCNSFNFDFTKYQEYLIKIIEEEKLNKMQLAHKYIDLHIIQKDKLNQNDPYYLQKAERILQDYKDSYYIYLTRLEIALFYFTKNKLDLCQQYLKKVENLEIDEVDKENQLLYLRIDYYKLLFELYFKNQNIEMCLQYLNKAIKLAEKLEDEHPERQYLLLVREYISNYQKDENTRMIIRNKCVKINYFYLNQTACDENYPTDHNFTNLLEKIVFEAQANQEFFRAEDILQDILKINQYLHGKTSLQVAQVREKLQQNQELNKQKEALYDEQSKKDVIEVLDPIQRQLDLECFQSKQGEEIQINNKEGVLLPYQIENLNYQKQYFIDKNEGQPDLKNAIQLLVDGLIAISECQISGFEHQDIKPENIVRINEDFYFIDFSSSKKSKCTTYFYCPNDYKPEDGFKRHDIYSLGLTILQYLRIKINDQKQIEEVQREDFKTLVNYIKYYMLNHNYYQRQSVKMMLKILCNSFYFDFTRYQKQLTNIIEKGELNQIQKALKYIELHIIQKDALNQNHPNYLLLAESILSNQDQKDSYHGYFTILEIAEFYFKKNNLELCQVYLKKAESLEKEENDMQNEFLYLRIDYYKLLFDLNCNKNNQNVEISLKYLDKALQLAEKLEDEHPERLYLLHLKYEHFSNYQCHQNARLMTRNQNNNINFFVQNQTACDLNHPTNYNYKNLLDKQVIEKQNNENYFEAEDILLDILKINQNLYGETNLNVAQVYEKLSKNKYLFYQKEDYQDNQTKIDIQIERINNFKKQFDLECCPSKLKEQIQLCEKEILKAKQQTNNEYQKQYFECVKNLLDEAIQKSKQDQSIFFMQQYSSIESKKAIKKKIPVLVNFQLQNISFLNLLSNFIKNEILKNSCYYQINQISADYLDEQNFTNELFKYDDQLNYFQQNMQIIQKLFVKYLNNKNYYKKPKLTDLEMKVKLIKSYLTSFSHHTCRLDIQNPKKQIQNLEILNTFKQSQNTYSQTDRHSSDISEIPQPDLIQRYSQSIIEKSQKQQIYLNCPFQFSIQMNIQQYFTNNKICYSHSNSSTKFKFSQKIKHYQKQLQLAQIKPTGQNFKFKKYPKINSFDNKFSSAKQQNQSNIENFFQPQIDHNPSNQIKDIPLIRYEDIQINIKNSLHQNVNNDDSSLESVQDCYMNQPNNFQSYSKLKLVDKQQKNFNSNQQLCSVVGNIVSRQKLKIKNRNKKLKHKHKLQLYKILEQKNEKEVVKIELSNFQNDDYLASSFNFEKGLTQSENSEISSSVDTACTEGSELGLLEQTRTKQKLKNSNKQIYVSKSQKVIIKNQYNFSINKLKYEQQNFEILNSENEEQEQIDQRIEINTKELYKNTHRNNISQCYHQSKKKTLSINEQNNFNQFNYMFYLEQEQLQISYTNYDQIYQDYEDHELQDDNSQYRYFANLLEDYIFQSKCEFKEQAYQFQATFQSYYHDAFFENSEDQEQISDYEIR
ncbi:hypothetical protein ABPG72_011694 [Tetrahymena utriculariae]